MYFFFKILIYIALPSFLSAQDLAPRQLYVDWDHRAQRIELGSYTGKKFKRSPRIVCKMEQLESEDIAQWLGRPAPESGVLLYFHAMWGQEIHFHRKMLRSLGKICATSADSTAPHAVISFIWRSGGILYERNWKRAAGKGEFLGALLTQISAAYKGKADVLCHSMGNRFFEGALRTAPEIPGQAALFETAVLFSADLDASVDDPDFERLRRMDRKTAIFQHRRDKLLLISSWIHGRKRLGRSGPTGTAEVLNLSATDMTKHARGWINHTHLDKKWVQERVAAALFLQR
jgi:esterase/lipase superfamily enzyme